MMAATIGNLQVKAQRRSQPASGLKPDQKNWGAALQVLA